MSNFKQKLIYIGFVFLCTLATLEAAAVGDNPFENLFDNELEGFFSGAGVGYGITRLEDGSAHDTSGRAHWKAGYAISERLGFYVTTIFTDFNPEFGLMWFPEQERRPANQRYYLLALVGYSSSGARGNIGTAELTVGASTLSLTGGIGYEFRRHFTFEGTAGYNQTEISSGFNQVGASAKIKSNTMTFIASVNYLFY